MPKRRPRPKKKLRVKDPMGESLMARKGRGEGAHGGSSRQQKKKERKKVKVKLKRGEYDGQ